jgi:zinc transport system substrate-binding protein
MNKKLWFIGAFAVILASCGQSPQSDPRVVTTLFPHYSLANSLAGDLVDVSFIIPLGSDPHDFDPTPSQRVKLNQADLVFFTSESFDTWIHSIEETATGTLIDLSTFVTLIEGDDHEEETSTMLRDVKAAGEEHEDHEYDPHYWIDPENGLAMLNAIAESLTSILPEEASLIESRRLVLASAMTEIVELYDSLVDENEEIDIVFAGHNALGYLVNYGIHVNTPYPGFSTDTAPTPQSLVDFNALIQSLSTNVLYVSSTDASAVIDVLLESNPQLIEVVIYTLENVSAAQFAEGVTYQELLMLNYEALATSEY